MTISQAIENMITYTAADSNVIPHDVEHFLKVWGYAKTIGELERVDEQTLFIIEMSAILHDIACPLCRRKYGNTNGKYQEIEGIELVKKFLKDSDLECKTIDRIVFLVSHHHTYTDVDSKDWQILLEADYIVNASESSYSIENIIEAYNNLFKTEHGRIILKNIYSI